MTFNIVAHSYSSSAIGHAGFYEVLRLTGRPVSRALSDTRQMAGQDGTILAIEPQLGPFRNAYNQQKEIKPRRLLVVLPKWIGQGSEMNRRWVGMAVPGPLKSAQDILDVLDLEATVTRHDWPAKWSVNDFSSAPAKVGAAQVQLINSPKLRPLIGNSEGMLLGEIVQDDRKIWVLADPDVLSNQGLGLGGNASLMVSVVDRLRMWENPESRSPIVIDEVMHNIRMVDGSVWQMLFRFPYVIVLILALISVVMMVLAGSGRFGAPVLPKADLDFGKSQLIANSVRLLDYAGHHGQILKDYIWMIIRLVARDLHAPKGQGDQAVIEWLDRLGKTRGVSKSCGEIVRAADIEVTDPKNAQRLYLCARDIHNWKGEILNGPHSPRSHR